MYQIQLLLVAVNEARPILSEYSLCLLFIHPRASPLIFLGRGGHYAFMLRLLLGSLISAFKTRQRAARFQRPGERGKERTKSCRDTDAGMRERSIGSRPDK